MKDFLRQDEIMFNIANLKFSADDLRKCLAAPAVNRGIWRQRVLQAMENLGKSVSGYISKIEANDGLLEDLEINHSTLSRKISQHRVENERLQRSIGVVTESLLDSQLYGQAELIEQGRAKGVEVLSQVEFLNYRYSDLLHEAYNLDTFSFNDTLWREEEVVKL